MTAPPDIFSVPVDNARIAVRHYTPSAPSGRPGVLLIHGLLGSADLFDVEGLESISFARRLRDAGWDVASYDQRGAGRSTADSWNFDLNTHARRDLPEVLAACRSRLGWERVVVVGHSLGGLIYLECLRTLRAQSRPDVPHVVAAVAIASPGALDRSRAPWDAVYRRGESFVTGLDRNGDDIVDRAEFTVAQMVLAWPWAQRVVRPSVVRWLLHQGSRFTPVAAMCRLAAGPILIYNADDFDNQTFRAVLRSKALDVASLALFRDLAQRLGTGVAPTTPRLDMPLLAIGSHTDRFVPHHEVEAFAGHFASPHVLETQKDLGSSSGHAGYFFKAELRDRVFTEVLQFLARALA